MTTSRNLRITFAYDYVLQHPDTSKRVLQAKLKETYGVGLRDEIVRKVLQESNTPNMLRYRLNTRAFTPLERRELKDFLRRGNPPYLALTINHRYAMYRQIGESMKKGGYTFREFIREYRRIVKQEAGKNSWLIVKPTPEGYKSGRRRGMVDIFKMLQDFRDKSIDSGEYIPLPKKKTKTSRGNLKAQKLRYHVKQSKRMEAKSIERERDKLQTWIASIDAQLVTSDGPKRRRLTNQRTELVNRMVNLK
jgi:hypothetical protein